MVIIITSSPLPYLGRKANASPSAQIFLSLDTILQILSPHYLLFSPPTPQTLNIHSSMQTIKVNCSHLLPFLSQHPRFLTSYWIHLVANSRMFIQVFIITCVSETGMVSAKAGKRRKQGIKKIKNKSPPPRLQISVVDLHQSQRLIETSVLLNSNCWLPELA